MPDKPLSQPVDPIRLEVFKHRFTSIAEEMGALLRKASFSPNIKERRDFSCAVFDSKGRMVAQAAHIPVHLGSMPLSVRAVVDKFSPENADLHAEPFTMGLSAGDVILLTDPFQGGTHLPDITMVSPVFSGGLLCGFVASRAHHADVGGMVAGSMPVAREIFQEGLIIPPVKLISAGEMNQGILDLILANVRTPVERMGDLTAQIACNQRGQARLAELVETHGLEDLQSIIDALLAYSERMTRQLFQAIPAGVYEFEDALDDDGVTVGVPVPIKVSIAIQADQATIDFSGSAPQQKGSINAVYAITLSAIFYVIRCLLDEGVPTNAGCLAPITVHAPAGSVVNAQKPAPVAGGNVETSQRIVDVLFGALAMALPGKIPAASQGTMNNVIIGGAWPDGRPFTYYETIGGGMGGRSQSAGPSALHSHMTNTYNTPAEALEYAYPLRVLKYTVRENSGGPGHFPGGDGIRRDIQTLVDAQLSLLTDRRSGAPYGLQAGLPGQPGENILIREGKQSPLPSKGTFELKAGDVLSIRTPGGGGYGAPQAEKSSPAGEG